MTDQKIEALLNFLQLPKDELDNPIDNTLGFVPSGLPLGISIMELFIGSGANWVSFFVCLAFFLYTIRAKLNERKIKKVHTGLSKKGNLIIIERIASEQSWNVKTNKTFYKEYLIPFILGHNGHKLTILIADGEILFNLRNIGTSRGRMPYLFGIDTLKEKKLKRRIEHYVTHNE